MIITTLKILSLALMLISFKYAYSEPKNSTDPLERAPSNHYNTP
jgi:hypothetical protein